MAAAVALVFLGAMATYVHACEKVEQKKRKKTKRDSKGQMRSAPPSRFNTYKGIKDPRE